MSDLTATATPTREASSQVGSTPTGERGTVLITGASSGIGRATALHLNRAGYRVVGTAQHQRGADSLVAAAEHRDAIRGVICDVTKADDVAALRRSVEGLVGEGGLTAVFSNAGIVNMSGDVSAEGCPVDTLERLIEVNYLGAVRAIQAHLPLLRASRGRLIVNTALMTHTVLPFNGGYAPSKAALETWADQLRREIRPHGVSVTVIRAAAVATALESGQNADSVPSDGPYAVQHDFVAGALAMMKERTEDRSCQPERIAELVEKAIEARRPPIRMLAGGGAHALWLIGALPERIQDSVMGKVIRRMAKAGAAEA